MNAWSAFPFADSTLHREPEALAQAWTRLHAGDAEPWPMSSPAQQAWGLYHAGQFQAAKAAGLQADRAGQASGWAAAWRAQAVYATYLARDESERLGLLGEVAQEAQARSVSSPTDANAHYLLAYALGRYSQAISVAQALARGLGEQVHAALLRTLSLRPSHADAHTALGTFHFEIIDSVGEAAAHALGVNAAAGLAAFERGLALHPASVVGRLELARALVLTGDAAAAVRAEALYREAAAAPAQDAVEALEIARAQAEIAD